MKDRDADAETQKAVERFISVGRCAGFAKVKGALISQEQKTAAMQARAEENKQHVIELKYELGILTEIMSGFRGSEDNRRAIADLVRKEDSLAGALANLPRTTVVTAPYVTEIPR